MLIKKIEIVLQNCFGLIVESILGRDWEVARAIFESLHPRGQSTDYGHPERVFFQKPQTFWLGRQIGLKFIEAFGVFLAELSAPILVL